MTPFIPHPASNYLLRLLQMLLLVMVIQAIPLVLAEGTRLLGGWHGVVALSLLLLSVFGRRREGRPQGLSNSQLGLVSGVAFLGVWLFSQSLPAMPGTELTRWDLVIMVIGYGLFGLRWFRQPAKGDNNAE